MKKFKLIKEYPGTIGSLGAIAEEIDHGSYSNYNVTLLEGTEKEFVGSFSTNYIENHPEFWKEIIEPLFGVTSYYYQGGFCLVLNGSCKDIDLFKGDDHNIRSIEILKTGEKFYVGDYARLIDEKWPDNCEISRIFVDEDGELKFEIKQGSASCIYFAFEENSDKFRFEKIVKPLFLTNTGKQIFEGDTYFMVEDDFSRIIEAEAHKNYTPKKAFSIREEAECWRFQNAPVLSFNDVLDIFPNLRSQKKGILSGTVNEKLNYESRS